MEELMRIDSFLRLLLYAARCVEELSELDELPEVAGAAGGWPIMLNCEPIGGAPKSVICGTAWGPIVSCGIIMGCGIMSIPGLRLTMNESHPGTATGPCRRTHPENSLSGPPPPQCLRPRPRPSNQCRAQAKFRRETPEKSCNDLAVAVPERRCHLTPQRKSRSANPPNMAHAKPLTTRAKCAVSSGHHGR